jgi:hypothetical protein
MPGNWLDGAGKNNFEAIQSITEKGCGPVSVTIT